MKKSKAQIQKEYDELERSVTERTHDLMVANSALQESEKRISGLIRQLNGVVEEERSRIAREIHDEFGQRLCGLKITLSSFKAHAEISAEMAAAIDSMLDEVDQNIYLLRKIANDLRPVILDKLGLFAAMEWLVKEFENKTGITTDSIIDIDHPVMDATLSINVFRICQEALTNIIKHAEATRASIRVLNNKDTVHIEIADNGKGIKPDNLHHPFSMGLLNMQERAKAIGAKMTIRSSPDTGSAIELIVPIRQGKNIDRRRSSQRYGRRI